MIARSISDHVRQNQGILAGLEKRALHWLAARMPRWVGSDHLTLLGLLSMLMAGVSYAVSRAHPAALGLVVVALALNWFGDSLDGTVARYRNQQRPRYGFYVDHVIDILGTVFLLGGLSISGYMSPMVSVALLAAFVAVEAEVFLATCVQGVFRLSALGFGPTELRIVLAVGTLYLLRRPEVTLGSLGPFLLFDVGGVVATAGMAVAFLFSAARTAAALYRAEPLPR
jgi:archaetidylinositol phosphate synthase